MLRYGDNIRIRVCNMAEHFLENIIANHKICIPVGKNSTYKAFKICMEMH